MNITSLISLFEMITGFDNDGLKCFAVYLKKSCEQQDVAYSDHVDHTSCSN